MSPIQFRFRTLLELRQSQRQQRHAFLAAGQRVEAKLLADVTEIEFRLRQNLERSRHLALQKDIDMHVLRDISRYETFLRGQRRKLTEQLIRVRAEVQRRRDALLEADQEVKSLEKYRDRLHIRLHREDERRVQLELDDMASARRPHPETPAA